jgi:hypothetical protein
LGYEMGSQSHLPAGEKVRIQLYRLKYEMLQGGRKLGQFLGFLPPI